MISDCATFKPPCPWTGSDQWYGVYCSGGDDKSGNDVQYVQRPQWRGLSFERDLNLRVPLHGYAHLKVLLVGCLRATLRISAIAIGTNNLVGTLPASLSVLTKLEYVQGDGPN